MPIEIVIEILTKKDCYLCDEIKKIVDKVLLDYSARLIITDIESDSILYEKFKERIPILKINDIESFFYKAHETSLRRKLDQLK
jgi:hypothetical protein